MRVLMIGDVVGKPGRRALTAYLPKLRGRTGPDFVIANGENAAGGLGITQETALPLFAAGVDVITLGNHTWAKREAAAYFEEEPRILRPANYPPGTPGRGWGVYTTASGASIGVANLLGRVFMEAVDCPFRAADQFVEAVGEETCVMMVDMHGEATSEKSAMGWHLDGRVSAIAGTHTHVQTSDERVLPGGTGYITDVGMVGPEDSVLGLDVQSVLSRFLTRMPGRFDLAVGPAVFSAVEFEIDEKSGRCLDIRRIRIREAEFDTPSTGRVQSGQEE